MQARDPRSYLLGLLLITGCWQPVSSALRTNFPSNIPVEATCVVYEHKLEQISGAITQMNQEGWRVMYISEGRLGFFFALPHTQICYERPTQQARGSGAGETGGGAATDSGVASPASQRRPRPLSAETTQQIVAQLDSAVATNRSQFVVCRGAPRDPTSVDAWVTVLGSGIIVGAQVQGVSEGVRPELAICVERALKSVRISPFEGERSNKKIQVPLQ